MDMEDIAYHRARADHERNIGLASSSLAVARAHLRLSSLHWQRVLELAGTVRATERPLFVL
jgi:hypothetical protein